MARGKRQLALDDVNRSPRPDDYLSDTDAHVAAEAAIEREEARPKGKPQPRDARTRRNRIGSEPIGRRLLYGTQSHSSLLVTVQM